MVLRQLVQNWLGGMVRRKVREQVAEAAREHVAAAARKPDTTESQQPSTPCHVGVLFALGIEAGALELLLDTPHTTRGDGFVIRQGRLAARRVAVVRSGAGCQSAAHATEALISGHQPEWVISAGFAGGLSPELRRHDILMVDRLVYLQGKDFESKEFESKEFERKELTVDMKVDPAALSAAPDVHVGRLLTADRVVRLPDEKRSLGRQFRALAVDMETYAVAEVCRRRHVRFLAVRVINDAVDEELPPDVERLLAQETTAARLGAATGAIWRRPSSIKDMYELRENALLASKRLAKFLCGMIEQL